MTTWPDGLQQAQLSNPRRHKITSRQLILLDDHPVRIVLRQGEISIGCSDVEIEVLRVLLKHYDDVFKDQPKEYELQP